MMSTKIGMITLVCFAVLGSLAHAIVPMGSTGVEDVLYAHSSGGYGAIYWQQYDTTGTQTGDQFLYNTSSEDIGYINSITARANSNGNVDMIYLLTKTAWSDVRVEELDTNGNRVGTTLLESDSVDGFRKHYSGVDVGELANGNRVLALSGLDIQGNSTLYLSIYDGNVRQSQSVLKSFAGDIGIGAVAFSDIDDDGSVELFYVTTADRIATVTRIDFDTAGNIVSETPDYIIRDLSAESGDYTGKALSVGQIDGDADKELLLGMSFAVGSVFESRTYAYDLTDPVGTWTGCFSREKTGIGLGNFLWQGLGIVDFSEETIDIAGPAGEVVEVIFGHSSGGFGGFWSKLYDDANGVCIDEGAWLYTSHDGADIDYIDSLTLKDWDGNGNIDMIYLFTSSGWSVVNMQELDSDRNRVGSVQLLESYMYDGVNKQYSGVDAGMFKVDGYPQKALVLSGLDALRNSTIYLSIYDGNERQSQSVLKSFVGDIGIEAVAFSDIDDDGDIELLYVTSDGGIATVCRIDFDSEGDIVSEDPCYIIKDYSWDTSHTCKALAIGQADDDDGKELLLVMSTYGGGMKSRTVAYDLDASPVEWPFLFSTDMVGTGAGGVVWQGIGIVDFSEDMTITDPTTCGEVIAYGYGYEADISTDCYINLDDLGMLADEWLGCTFVDDASCTELSVPPVVNPIPMGIVIVDGDLSDWAGADWIVMDQTYYISDANGAETIDITSAEWSAKWSPETNLIYVAVVVEDSDHCFMPGHFGWDGQDAAEFYINADISTLGPYGPYDPTAAQQYVVASADGSEAEWAVFGDGVDMPSDMLPDYEVSVDGDIISYEIAIVPYEEVDPYLGGTNVIATIMTLTKNMTIGFDVIANTKWSSGEETYFAMLCENTNGGKSSQAYDFTQFTLVDQACGAWGFLEEDINGDCKVDMMDFAELGNFWLYCNDPEDASCNQTW